MNDTNAADDELDYILEDLQTYYIQEPDTGNFVRYNMQAGMELLKPALLLWRDKAIQAEYERGKEDGSLRINADAKTAYGLGKEAGKRAGAIEELNRLIDAVGPIIKGETWKDWSWRVKDYLAERETALADNKEGES